MKKFQVMYNAEGGSGGSTPPPTPPTLSAENVTAFLSENPNILGDILKTEVAKPYVQPLVDSHFSKGLETWKANNLDKIVNERVESLFPNETPQAKQMRELQAQIDRINGEKQQAVMGTFTTQELVNNNLPTQFARFLQGNDEATTRANISDFQTMFTQHLNGTVDSKFKQMSHTPQTSPSIGGDSQVKEVGKMSYAERLALYQSNPNEYNRLMGK
jgi:hypothetical protein